jgi:signal transduction histidine kinase
VRPIVLPRRRRVVGHGKDPASAQLAISTFDPGRTGRRRARSQERPDVVRTADAESLGESYVPFVNLLRRLWMSDRGRLLHYVAAASLAAFLIVDMFSVEGDSRPWFVLVGVLAAIALLATRDAPFVAPLIVLALGAATALIDEVEAENLDAIFVVVVLFVPWCLGAYNDVRRAIVGLIAVEAAFLWVNLQFDNGIGDYFWIGAFGAVAWTGGFILNRRTEHAQELAERSQQLEREHAQAAERAVLDERQRIARELHDVIAHSVSVMTVQAGAVRRLLLPEQERERQALETIEHTGREALTEMRRLLGLLREGGATPEYAPQPSLKALDSLVAKVRESGLPVEVHVDGEPRELPAGVDLSAYRVVQEALTNAIKHGQASQAWVEIHWFDDAVQLEVANDGDAAGTGDGTGRGLVGMRERVAVVGGELESGPREGGGYLVRARLPVSGAAT